MVGTIICAGAIHRNISNFKMRLLYKHLCAVSLYNFLNVERDWNPILSAIEEGLAGLLYMGPMQQCLQT